MKLPHYIYQLIDHIYISDNRSVIYANQFYLVINCSNINQPSNIEKKQMGNTLFINLREDPNGSSSITNKNILYELIKVVKLNKSILLYSDPYEEACDLFISYLIENYHFTKEDIHRMVLSRNMNNELKRSMEKELNKKE